jgi:ATP dependent DNA ligase domain
MPKSLYAPCIPTRGTKVPSHSDWIHEVKQDGFRLIVQREGERVRLFTRNGYDWTSRYPQIVEAARRIRTKQFVLDGEAVLWRGWDLRLRWSVQRAAQRRDPALRLRHPRPRRRRSSEAAPPPAKNCKSGPDLAPATSSQKGPALLPPYTTGIVRIRSNLDMNLGRRVAMASCRSKVRVAVRSLVKRRERIRRRIRRVGASIVRA